MVVKQLTILPLPPLSKQGVWGNRETISSVSSGTGQELAQEGYSLAADAILS